MPDIKVITPEAVVIAFAGDGLAAARSTGLPARVVYLAVKLIAAERDWLIGLKVASAISTGQRERLDELQLLLAIGPKEGLCSRAIGSSAKVPHA